MPSTDFRFYLGSTALNFAATRGMRRGTPIERIPAPSDLGRWLASAGFHADAPPTDREYAAALALREAIYTVGSALTDGGVPRDDDIETINRAARQTAPVPQLARTAQGLRVAETVLVRAALALVARDAIEVFAHEPDRLTRCEDAACGALLRTQRGDVRRWCSMKTCGNRAKVAAYRARRAGTAT